MATVRSALVDSLDGTVRIDDRGDPVVDVGEPSETETRTLYRDATEEINVLTKSFGVLPERATRVR